MYRGLRSVTQNAKPSRRQRVHPTKQREARKEGQVRKISTLVVLLVVAICVLGIWAAAQAPLPQRPPQSGSGSEPTVISGSDIGFRMESRRGNTAVGRLVVRINGQWLDIEESVVAKRLTAR
jgi:hypothetical protein